jgi:phosphomevalonate kinase
MKEALPSVIYSAVNNASLWTQTITCFSLPPSVDLIMGDVCGGSSSVSMVRENNCGTSILHFK